MQNWNAKNNSASWLHHIVDKEKNAQIYCEICNRDKFEQEKKHRHKKIENPKFVDKKTHRCYNINVTCLILAQLCPRIGEMRGV